MQHVSVLVAAQPLVLPVEADGSGPTQMGLQHAIFLDLMRLDVRAGLGSLVLRVWVVNWFFDILALLLHVTGALPLPILVQVLNLRLSTGALRNMLLLTCSNIERVAFSWAASLRCSSSGRREMQFVL